MYYRSGDLKDEIVPFFYFGKDQCLLNTDTKHFRKNYNAITRKDNCISGCFFIFMPKLSIMKTITILPLCSFCFYIFPSCSTTPENYFDIAVLNCNMMHGFASNGLQRELESPSVKLVEGTTDQTAPMKRKEIIDSKIEFITSAMEKVKSLKATEETKNMLQASVALYEYVLPVYKNEYQQLAKLYDDGAPDDQLQAMEKTIEEKYYPNFEVLFNQLTTEAKPYAAKNNINVNWDVKTSPQ
jgi:hypothetical protein